MICDMFNLNKRLYNICPKQFRVIARGLAQVVERSIRIREARGSIPRSSIPFQIGANDVCVSSRKNKFVYRVAQMWHKAYMASLTNLIRSVTNFESVLIKLNHFR